MLGIESSHGREPVGIDVDEFLEARHDPAVHSLLPESQAYGRHHTDAPEFSDGRPAHAWRTFFHRMFEQMGRQESDSTSLHPF